MKSLKHKPLQRRHRPSPTSDEETKLRSEGYYLIAGLDEAGRGPLAGPVVAGIAILPPKMEGEWTKLIRDSKIMTKNEREEVFHHLKSEAVSLEVGVCSANEIDKLGIVQATQIAMRRALLSLTFMPQFLLLDAFPLPDVTIPQKAIIKGDSKCLSIAAASVAAKITRDKIMEEQDALFPEYGFARHKGYASKEHLRQLELLGPCPIHRHSFSPLKEKLTS